MPRLVPLALFFAVQLVAQLAYADVGDWEAQYDPGRAVRRSDFAAGLILGGLFGRVAGYPNEVDKIDDPDARATTGPAGGTAGGLWVGAALRDWFVAGLGVNFGSIAGAEGTLSNGGAFVLHLEVFPLFYQAEAWRDFAVVGEFGAGSRDIFEASREAADGGAMSYLSLGALYEPFRVGEHVSAGPILLLSHQFSQSVSAFLVTAGIQLAFYGGPG